MNKKAQGISLNVVVIAAIALLVLIVLAVIFMVRLGVFSGETKTCEAQGGKCLSSCSSSEATSTGFTQSKPTWKCSTGTCCIVGG